MATPPARDYGTKHSVDCVAQTQFFNIVGVDWHKRKRERVTDPEHFCVDGLWACAWGHADFAYLGQQLSKNVSVQFVQLLITQPFGTGGHDDRYE